MPKAYARTSQVRGVIRDESNLQLIKVLVQVLLVKDICAMTIKRTYTDC